MENNDEVIRIRVPKFRGISTSKLRKNPWIMSTFVLIVLAVVLLFNGTGDITGDVISENQAGQKVLELVQLEDSTAELVSVNDIGGLYEVIISFSGEEVPIYITLDGENLISGLVPISLLLGETDVPIIEDEVEGSTFIDTGDEILRDEDGKPYVLLFSTTWCPHCEWIQETFDGLTDEFGDQVNIQHWEIDIGDNTITSEVETEVPEDMMEIYRKYNPDGSIPTFVFGGKYARVGNGYESQSDLAAELEDFKFIIGKLLEA